VRDNSATALREGLEESLRWLGIDHVDVFFLHWPDPKVAIADTARTVAEFVTEGKVRYVGLSNHSPDQITEFTEVLPVSLVQSPYSLFRRGIELELLQYCVARGIGVVTYGALVQGLLSGRIGKDTVFPPDDWRVTSPIFSGPGFENNVSVVEELGEVATEFGVGLPELAVAWVLSNPAVACAIFGARQERHLPAMYRAASTVLGDELLQRVEAIVRRATPVGGPSPERGGVDE
jgi:aryl-alcohol dehydrogenase-like predicted oxidoreductase